MAATSRRFQTDPILRSGRFRHHSPPPYTSAFASTSGGLFQRTTSPTRVNSYGSSPSVRFSLDRSSSPGRSLAAAVPRTAAIKPRGEKRTCMCSPTSHAGSFRCSLHKNCDSAAASPYSPSRLNARRSAMTNSLVRIGGVEGEIVRRALAALIRPSSHQQRRRNGFRPRPSRLSVVSTPEDL